jgi:hypothetical protein
VEVRGLRHPLGQGQGLAGEECRANNGECGDGWRCFNGKRGYFRDSIILNFCFLPILLSFGLAIVLGRAI